MEDRAIWLRSSIKEQIDVKKKMKERNCFCCLFSLVVLLEARDKGVESLEVGSSVP